MRLLLTVQAVDADDPALSFIIEWIHEISKHFDSVRVVCLQKGRHDLPPSIPVYSLGKEHATGFRALKRLVYAWRLLKYSWQLRGEYDVVLVHQIQEHVLVAGLLWKKLRKPVSMWRNHYKGSFATRLAIALCHKVFYTSRFSYTAAYAKAVQMPVGVVIKPFTGFSPIQRTRRSILFLGRIAPSKRPHVLLEALGILYGEHVPFTASIYGRALPEDREYASRLEGRVKAAGMMQAIQFHDGIPHAQVPEVLEKFDIFVNLAKSGMLDKTIFEAGANGCVVVTSSEDLKNIVDPRTYVETDSAEDLARKLRVLLELTERERQDVSEPFTRYVRREHSLEKVGTMLAQEIS